MMIGKFGKYAAGQPKHISGQTSSNLSQQSMNQAKSIARWCVSVSQCVCVYVSYASVCVCCSISLISAT